MQEHYHEDKRFPTWLIALIVVIIVIAVIVSFVLWYFSSNYYGYYGNPYGYGGMMGGFGGLGMLFFMPIGVIIVVLIIYALYRGLSWGGHYDHIAMDERENAVEILRRRYAKGEITKEQFEQMKRDIS